MKRTVTVGVLLVVTGFVLVGYFLWQEASSSAVPVKSKDKAIDGVLRRQNSVICPGEKINDYHCYESAFQKITQERGADEAFIVLKNLYPIRHIVSKNCHPLTHVIGRAAATSYPDVSVSFLHGDSFCWSGYYHGVMEGVIKKVGRPNLAKSMESICAKVPGKAERNFNYYNCVHGLGHGVMESTEVDLVASLMLCDYLLGNWEQQSCYGGVFMENINVNDSGSVTGHSTKFLSPDDPVYPCNFVDEKYRTQCYQMQTSYMMRLFSGDFQRIFGVCSQVEPRYRSICFQSLGRDASGSTVSDPVRVKAICDLGPTEDARLGCLDGAARDFVSYYHSDDKARLLCGLLLSQDQLHCNQVVTTYLTHF